jgi:EAL domain-containing protein (putative c-di-GMP-specific phosphodiesterase class I)
MKRKVIAEGVETDAQREFLQSHHCDEIQGHHFSKPAPAEEIEHLLREMTAA